MGRRNGSTLIEALLSISIGFIVLYTMSILFCGLGNLNLNQHNDLSYCLYSLTEEVSMAREVIVEDDCLTLKTNDQQYLIHLHNNRIVKEPGFNIYLHQVDDISFSHDDQYVYISIERGEQSETFKIGVFFRPSYRICESDCSDDITDDVESDSGYSRSNSNIS